MLTIDDEKIRQDKDWEKLSEEDSTTTIAVTFTILIKLLDIYIDHRIKQDKVIEGILRDIQAAIQQNADKKPYTAELS